MDRKHTRDDTVADAEKTIDQGPTFGTPGDPPDLDPKAKHEIIDPKENLDAEQGFPQRPEPVPSDAK